MLAMKRRLFNILSGVSLLLCIATTVLWPRSFWRYDSISWNTASSTADLISVRGHVAAGLTLYADSSVYGSILNWYSYPVQSVQSDLEWAISDWPSGEKWKAGGFGFYVTKETIAGTVQWLLVAPAWSAFIFYSALPILWFVRRGNKPGQEPHANIHTTANHFGRQHCDRSHAVRDDPGRHG
jgi:hypothetical protein